MLITNGRKSLEKKEGQIDDQGPDTLHQSRCEAPSCLCESRKSRWPSEKKKKNKETTRATRPVGVPRDTQ